MTTPKRVSQHNKELSNRDDSSSESTESVPPILSSTKQNVKSLMYTNYPQNLKLKVPQKDLFFLLPNELFESVLKRLEVQNLLSLRQVNPRWLVMIESICKKKRSLALVSPNFAVNLQDRFDGQLNLSRLNYLRLKPMKPNLIQSSVDLCTQLGKLFPSVQHLFVDDITNKAYILVRLHSLWSVTLVTLYFDDKLIIDAQINAQICAQINALHNLKNLDLPSGNCLPLKSLGPTLKRLHSVAIDIYII